MTPEERIAKLANFIDHELGDYSYFADRILEHTESCKHKDSGSQYEIANLVMKFSDGSSRSVRFRVQDDSTDIGDIKVEVEVSEDIWRETDWWSNNVRYFWQAILIW